MERQKGRLIVGGLLLLVCRGLLLWIVVPLSVLAWPVAALLSRGVTLGKWLGWVDLNLVSLLQRTIFRRFFSDPVPRVPFAEIQSVRHRIGWTDPT